MKMKKTRKRIALLVMLCMLTMLLPAGTAHADSWVTIGDMVYNTMTSGNEYKANLIKYNGENLNVEIPNTVIYNGTTYNVREVHRTTFEGRTDIVSISIPENVSFIQSETFADCSNLTQFGVATGNKNYLSVDGVLFNKDQTSLIAYPAKKTGSSYTIPTDVTSILTGAFQNCLNLQEINVTLGNTTYSSEGGGIVLHPKSKKRAH